MAGAGKTFLLPFAISHVLDGVNVYMCANDDFMCTFRWNIFKFSSIKMNWSS